MDIEEVSSEGHIEAETFPIATHGFLQPCNIEKQNNERKQEIGATLFPCCILETILSYTLHSCSDIVIFSSICKNWYNELKDLSPVIWKTLLDRNSWPYLADTSCQRYAIRAYRLAYIYHHGASRILRSIQSGITFRRENISSNNCSQQQRSINMTIAAEHPKMKNRSTECISLKIWKSSYLISAYADCTLRVHKFSAEQEQVTCNDILYLPLTEIQSKMVMLCMEVSYDDDVVTFLCKTLGSNDFVFGLIHCNDLINSATNSDRININIEDRIKYYTLNDFVEEYYQDKYYETTTTYSRDCLDISNEFVSCGKGTYMFELSIIHDQDQDGSVSRNMRFLFLFSVITKRISWTYTLPYLSTTPFLHMAIQRNNNNDSSKSNTSETPTTTKIILFYLQMLIQPFAIFIDENRNLSEVDNNNLLILPSYNLNGYSLISRKVLALQSHIIVADTYENLWNFQYIPKVNILPINGLSKSEDSNSSNELKLSIRNRKIFDICTITTQSSDNEYIFLLLKSMGIQSMIGMIIHVPSKLEISRVELSSKFLTSVSSFHSTCSERFFALSVSSLYKTSIILTANNKVELP